MRNRKGLAELSTAIRSRLRSKPKARDNDFLALYPLESKRARITQEILHLQNRLAQCRKQLEDIREEMSRLIESEDAGKVSAESNKKPPDSIEWTEPR
jgi:hypothetical protein